MTTLIACIDASRYAEAVCDHAAWAAGQLGATVELMHALDRHEIDPVRSDRSGTLGFGEQEALLEELAALDEQRGRLALRRGRSLLDEAAVRLRAAGLTEIEAHQRHGTLVETIAERQASVDLIVIGKQGEATGRVGTKLGLNLERVARAIRTPLLVSSQAFRPIRRVLIAFDGSRGARKAVAYVANTPLLAGTACRVVTVGDDHGGAREQLAGAVELLATAGFETTSDVLPGHPEQALAAETEASCADLLVMGAHGHSRIRTLIIGNTTTALLRSSAVTVLMVG